MYIPILAYKYIIRVLLTIFLALMWFVQFCYCKLLFRFYYVSMNSFVVCYKLCEYDSVDTQFNVLFITFRLIFYLWGYYVLYWFLVVLKCRNIIYLVFFRKSVYWLVFIYNLNICTIIKYDMSIVTKVLR